jgi:hypothetical protein
VTAEESSTQDDAPTSEENPPQQVGVNLLSFSLLHIKYIITDRMMKVVLLTQQHLEQIHAEHKAPKITRLKRHIPPLL